ncbi:MAG: deoxyribose-phosphate aldolase [Terracidiphilus sp.]
MKIGNVDLSRKALAQAMDFSSLNPHVSEAEILECCAIARSYQFKGFHTNPVWMSLVAHELEGTGIETACLVSFPFGTSVTEIKVAEAKHGARLLRGKPWVIDMVTSIGKLRSKDFSYYKNDIAEVAKVAHDGGAECKAILEVGLLNDEELRIACELAVEAGADWVKSSTGREKGPTLDQVRKMRLLVPPHIKVKVAGTGSFWTPMVALGCMLAGAERIGTRNAPWIVDELSKTFAEMVAAEPEHAQV